MSVVNLGFLIEVHEMFLKIRKLFKDKLVNMENQMDVDLEDGIYLVDTMLSKIDEKLTKSVSSNNEFNFRLIGMKITLLYEKSKFYIYFKQFDRALEILQDTYTEFKSHIFRPELGYIILCILNRLSYYVNFVDPVKAINYLEESELHYYNMIQSNNTFSWYTTDDLFSLNLEPIFQNNNQEKFEKLFLKNMQFLCFIYFTHNEMDKYILYQHYVLNKQLLLMDTDVAEWASKVARLATILLHLEKFHEARHHLAAATCVVEANLFTLTSALPSSLLYTK
uniref:KIF-binding protein n=2 Tax=Clastoptera arizonana TaxID=38151 RepID=A0A1B6DZF4_9HEMI